jgi:hypothetical protein
MRDTHYYLVQEHSPGLSTIRRATPDAIAFLQERFDVDLSQYESGMISSCSRSSIARSIVLLSRLSPKSLYELQFILKEVTAETSPY